MKDRTTPRRVVDWGHVTLLLIVCAVVVAYLLDARATSLKINNLLLVEPASIIALILAALVLPQCFRRKAPQASEEGAAPVQRESWLDLGKIAAMSAAFGAFTLSLETIGFDVATFIFLALGTYICGERRPWVIALFSGLFTAAIVYGYQLMVPYPFPLLVM